MGSCGRIVNGYFAQMGARLHLSPFLRLAILRYNAVYPHVTHMTRKERES
jgi:hypothetical protein